MSNELRSWNDILRRRRFADFWVPSTTTSCIPDIFYGIQEALLDVVLHEFPEVEYLALSPDHVLIRVVLLDRGPEYQSGEDALQTLLNGHLQHLMVKWYGESEPPASTELAWSTATLAEGTFDFVQLSNVQFWKIG